MKRKPSMIRMMYAICKSAVIFALIKAIFHLKNGMNLRIN